MKWPGLEGAESEEGLRGLRASLFLLLLYSMDLFLSPSSCGGERLRGQGAGAELWVKGISGQKRLLKAPSSIKGTEGG